MTTTRNAAPVFVFHVSKFGIVDGQPIPTQIQHLGWSFIRTGMSNSSIEFTFGGGAARVLLCWSKGDPRIAAAGSAG